MNIPLLKLSPCLMLMSFSVLAQTPVIPGMQTYSPYTAGQLKALNDQPLSPVEGPFGAIAPNSQEFNLSKKPSMDAKYYQQPEGEEEAEALEMQSADPYQASRPVLTF